MDAAASHRIIQLTSGTYFNKGFNTGDARPPPALNNGVIVNINGKTNMTLEAAPGASPKLTFDGKGAIEIRASSHVTVRGLDIEGPANRISGREASLNRQRMTSKDATGGTSGTCKREECHSCGSKGACVAIGDCRWFGSTSKCGPKSLSYYQGAGIAVWGGSGSAQLSHSITIADNRVHHCCGSGIRANMADHMLITGNVIYDNCWWTVSATSGVVFAEKKGSGSSRITRNVVCVTGGRPPCMPRCMQSGCARLLPLSFFFWVGMHRCSPRRIVANY